LFSFSIFTGQQWFEIWELVIIWDLFFVIWDLLMFDVRWAMFDLRF